MKRVIKLPKGTLGKPKVQPETRLIRDYGTPTLRTGGFPMSSNPQLRTPLTQPKIKKRNTIAVDKWINVPVAYPMEHIKHDIVKPSFNKK